MIVAGVLAAALGSPGVRQFVHQVCIDAVERDVVGSATLSGEADFVAIRALDDILARMGEVQRKSRTLLRRIHSWDAQ